MPFVPHLAQMVTYLITHLSALSLYVAQHHHLSVREFLVLGVLATQRSARLTELHQSLSIPKSSLTGVVDRLRARGVVELHQDQRDRRRWLTSLTPSGERLASAVKEEEARLMEDSWRNLSEDEREAFAKSLEVITKELAQAQPREQTARDGGAWRARRLRRKEV